MTSVEGGAAAVGRVSATIGGGGGGGRASITTAPNGVHQREVCRYFEMPLHYPRYTKADYESMPEWKLDCLLAEYGLPLTGNNLEQKRNFAMGAFLWLN